jgi:hypothetical protein
LRRGAGRRGHEDAIALEKMMPLGKSQFMRECDRLPMQQNIKTEDRARFATMSRKMK